MRLTGGGVAGVVVGVAAGALVAGIAWAAGAPRQADVLQPAALPAAPYLEPSPGQPVAAPPPPVPEDLGPDGDLLPGTPAYQQRAAAAQEYEAYKARVLAEAQLLAPRADAIARTDERLADLLVGATYDMATVEAIAGTGETLSGAVLTYDLPAPRDFFFDYSGLTGYHDEEIGAVSGTGLRQLAVGVKVEESLLFGVRFLVFDDIVGYDREGNVVTPGAATPGTAE